MSEPPLALDVSRLLWRAIRKAPGGIDRLELAMARHLLAEEPSARFLFTDGGVVRTVKPAALRRFTTAAARRWEGTPGDAPCRRVAAYLAGDDAAFPLARTRWTDRWVPLTDLARSSVAGMLHHRGAFEPGEPGGLANMVYLNLSHRNLDNPLLLAALARFSRVLCYLHDDIPLRQPRFAAPGLDASFRRMLLHLAQLPSTVVTNSQTSRARLMESATGLGVRLSRVEVVAPPVAEHFSLRAVPPLGIRPFFLLPGLVTARKNIGLILRACRENPAQAVGFDVVLAGAAGLDAAAVLAGMGEPPAGIRILRAEGLSDHAMALLARGARAVLAPSLDEGFDYPVHEALAGGVPVLASDIPAHREYVAGFAELLDPHDAAAWGRALRDFTPAASPRRSAALAAAERFSPPEPAQLMRRLAELARGA